MPTHRILQVLSRQAGRTVSSISFSRNAASYFPRPRLRSQTTTSIGRPQGLPHHDPSPDAVSSWDAV